MKNHFKGSWLHLQDYEYLREYSALSGRELHLVTGYHVLTRKRPILGYLNAYLYSPEIIKPLTEDGVKQLRAWMTRNGIGQMHVYSTDNASCISNWTSHGGTLFLDLERTEHELWANCTQRCRTAIRKAEKHGVRIEYEATEETYNRWYNIYSQLASKRGFSTQAAKELKGLLELGWGRLLTAWSGNTMLGGVFFLMRAYCIPLAAGFGEGEEYRRYSPGNLLFWEAIRYAKKLGMSFFDFMGANDARDHGPTRFKESFGGQFIRVYESQLEGSMRKRIAGQILTYARRVVEVRLGVSGAIAKISSTGKRDIVSQRTRGSQGEAGQG